MLTAPVNEVVDLRHGALFLSAIVPNQRSTTGDALLCSLTPDFAEPGPWPFRPRFPELESLATVRGDRNLGSVTRAMSASDPKRTLI